MKIIKLDYSTIYLLFILFICGFIRIGLTILVIILIHELGHILVCLYFKFKIINVTIYPFGGITHIEKDLNTPVYKDILLALGGIFMQLILMFINNPLFIKYNLSIMLFNMLPIIPLDGSYLLKAILNKFYSFKRAYFIYVVISIISIFIYIGFNYKYSINNYLIISIFTNLNNI